MKLNIRAVHFELNNEIRDYAAEKIGKLDDFYKNILLADIAIENHESEKKDKHSYMAKVKLEVPGKNIFAEGSGPDEFAAIDNVEQKLKIQVEKLKSKQNRGKLDKFQRIIRNFIGRD
ncbi:MAG: ribosome-associated translation inhibitor RaiA [Patescibacteria group bacterium]|nr:ribosome-associated translation inhibitor RaiA [Patescibacteria group bacterium]